MNNDIRKVFLIISDMENELISEWNNEMDRWNILNCSREEVERNMDIIEGKSVILEQLKERLEKQFKK